MEEKKEKEEKSGFLATDLLSMLKKTIKGVMGNYYFVISCFGWYKYGVAVGVSKL